MTKPLQLSEQCLVLQRPTLDHVHDASLEHPILGAHQLHGVEQCLVRIAQRVDSLARATLIRHGGRTAPGAYSIRRIAIRGGETPDQEVDIGVA
jgi:hypothetical protein